MGGKSSPDYPDPIDPMKTAEAQWTLTQRQAELDKQNRQADRDYAAQQEAAKQTQRNADLESAYASALNTAASRAANEYGMTMDDAPAMRAYYDSIKAGIPSTATDFSSYFGPSTFDTYVNQLQSLNRNQYSRTLNEDMPSDDAVINAILAEQYNDALNELQGYRNSGTITDDVYGQALGRLDAQKTGAGSKLQSLGGGVLSGYRGQLSDISSAARDEARNYTLGGSFDPSRYTSRASALTGDLQSRLEGDIRSALGDTNLFDIGSLVGKSMNNVVTNPGGTSSAGAALPGTSGFSGTAGSSPLLGALADQVKKKTTDRTTSSEGAF
jgi:hypothetical protein